MAAVAEAKTKMDIAAEVTNRVVEQLKEGKVPWQRPWTLLGAPSNLVSKKQYRGINLFLLAGATSPYWLTFKQAKDLGGNVKKGEKGSLCVFWKRISIQDKNGAEGDKKVIPFMRHYHVFNADQCEGLEKHIPKVEKFDNNPIEAAEKVVAGFIGGPGVDFGGDRAFYSPSFDKVSIPPMDRFKSAAAYYSTLFHEMIHSTGHADRLGRFENGVNQFIFASNSYSQEELVAEMGAAMLMGHCGLLDETIENTSAYLANWLGKLQDDKNLLVSAASKAQKAVDAILGTKFEEEKQDVEQENAVGAGTH